jgi:hypothetical protein
MRRALVANVVLLGLIAALAVALLVIAVARGEFEGLFRSRPVLMLAVFNSGG